jgi:hypothetical protein
VPLAVAGALARCALCVPRAGSVALAQKAIPIAIKPGSVVVASWRSTVGQITRTVSGARPLPSGRASSLAISPMARSVSERPTIGCSASPRQVVGCGAQ